MSSDTTKGALGTVDSGSDDMLEGPELLRDRGLEIEGELELGNCRHEMFPVFYGSGEKNSGTVPATTQAALSEQRARCKSNNFTADSPRGSAVRPCSMSDMEEGASPTSPPISAKVIPFFRRRSVTSDAQAIAMGATLRLPAVLCQRQPTTAFRDNWLMLGNETFGDRVKKLRGQMSRRALSKKSHVPESTIADIENKHREKSEHAKALADALGVTLAELLIGSSPEGSPAPSPPQVWPFEELALADIEPLDAIERSYVEQAALKALYKIRSERRRHRKTG